MARAGAPIRPSSIAALTRRTAGYHRRWLMTDSRTPLLAARRDHAIRIGGMDGQRLLDDDRQSRLGCLDRLLGVARMRRAQHDGIHAATRDALREPGVGTRAEPLGEGGRPAGVAPGDGDEAGARDASERRCVDRGDLAGTDQREADVALGVRGETAHPGIGTRMALTASRRPCASSSNSSIASSSGARCSMRAVRPRGDRRWRGQRRRTRRRTRRRRGASAPSSRRPASRAPRGGRCCRST